jgi:hypothetical protein
LSYSYQLLKYEGTGENSAIIVVEPEKEIPTLDELHKLVVEHIGMLPDWLMEVSKDTYLQEEDEQGDFIVCIEGAEHE